MNEYNPPDFILVLAWNYFEYIKKNNKELRDLGCKLITLKQLENGGLDEDISRNI